LPEWYGKVVCSTSPAPRGVGTRDVDASDIPFDALDLIRGFILMVAIRSRSDLRSLDKALLSSLEAGVAKRKTGRFTRDPSFDSWLRQIDSLEDLKKLAQRLSKAGLFDIRTERHTVYDVDGDRFVMTMARAASTDMWPMGTNYWVRDNALIGARYLASGDPMGIKLGRELLMSALNFLSTVSQLKRFEGIIRSKSMVFKINANNWPFIFVAIKDNLNSAKHEGWAHKQDAWQIVAWYILDAIDSGALSRSALSRKNRKFFGAIVPFLCAISFYRAENSGSWEEIPAIRSSVRAWEHRLIVRLAELSKRRGWTFLNRDFERSRRYLPKSLRKLTLVNAVAKVEGEVLKAMLRDLPYESPCYPRRDPRHRASDAALIYLLQLDYPAFLAERSRKSQSWATLLEAKILSEILSLSDSKSGGVYRYANDSYQRSGFFRNEVAAELAKLYGAPSGDASKHFTGRDRIVPKGRKAAWTHFVWQLSAWAGERYLLTGEKRYKQLHTTMFKRGLGLVTGARELSVEQLSNGEVRVFRVPKYRMPECFISDSGPSGRERVFPSPHTPLNWSVGEMFDAFRVRETVLAQSAIIGARRRPKAA